MQTVNPCSTANGKFPFLPAYLKTVPPEILKKAETELNETPERRKEALKELKRLIHEEVDFRPVMDDDFLVRFLRAKKFDSQQAFDMLKNFYVYKLRYSKMLTDFKPSELKHVLDRNIFSCSPYRDREGRVILLARLEGYDPSLATREELLAAAFCSAEVHICSEVTQICGVVLLGDFKGMTLSLARYMGSPSHLYRLVRLGQDCYPARLKAFHFINVPFYFNIIHSIIKVFLTEKIKSRIFLHGSNLKNLHKIIPPSNLPKEFGGELGDFDSSDFTKRVLSTEGVHEKYLKHGFQAKKAQFIRKKSSMSFGLYL